MAMRTVAQSSNVNPVEILTNVGHPNNLSIPQGLLPPQLRPYLSDCLRQCTYQKRALIIIICANSSELWLRQALSSELKALPLDEYQDILIEKTEDVLQDLHHHWDTSNVILDQSKSPMSLVFNVETVVQSQAVAHLNLLAFAFLSLSVVTGIFGMTTWNSPAVWYPLWASVAVLLVVTAAYCVCERSLSTMRMGSLFCHAYAGTLIPSLVPMLKGQIRTDCGVLQLRALQPWARQRCVTTKVPYVAKENLPQRWDSLNRKARGSRRAKRLSLRERAASSSIPQSRTHDVYNPPVSIQTVSLGNMPRLATRKTTPHNYKQMKKKAEPYSLQDDASSGDSSDESRTSRGSPTQHARVLGEAPLQRQPSHYRERSHHESRIHRGVNLSRPDEAEETYVRSRRIRTPPDVARVARVARVSNSDQNYQVGLSLIEEHVQRE